MALERNLQVKGKGIGGFSKFFQKKKLEWKKVDFTVFSREKEKQYGTDTSLCRQPTHCKLFAIYHFSVLERYTTKEV